MRRKSQITIFIAIGILIVIAVAYLWLSLRMQTQAPEDLSGSGFLASSIRNYVQACLKSSAEDGIVYISAQGGYYMPGSDYLMMPKAKVPYYYESEKNGSCVPDRAFFEGQLSDFVSDSVESCIGSFSSFEQSGVEIKAVGSPEAGAVLGKKAVISLEYPLSARKGDEIISVSDFSESVDFDFDKVYGVVSSACEAQRSYPNQVPLSDLMISAQKGGATFRTVYISDDEVVFSFLFNGTALKGRELYFNYASRYNWSGLNSSVY